MLLVPHGSQFSRVGLSGLMLAFLIAAFGVAAFVATSPQAVVAAKGKKLVWKSCGKKAQAVPRARCAFLTVPQNYKRPGGKKFRLAMVKVPARGKKKGSLFFNPGGPGDSGVESVLVGEAEALPRSIRRNFDFVSWDPRGVGATRPAVRGCRAFDPTVNPLPDTGDATNAQWLQLLSPFRKAQQKAARQCLRLKRNRGFPRHMGTRNVVRDLDRMRAAVGDRKLTFWGGSYGTRIGYTYALKYPKRLRAILLDGSVNPAGNYRDFARVRAQATDRALKVIRQVRPAFGNRIITTRDDLRKNGPITLKGENFTQWDFELNVSENTLAQFQWREIQKVMNAVKAARSSDPQQKKKAEDKLREALDLIKGSPYSPGTGRVGKEANEDMATRIINHLDYADSTIPAEVRQKMVLDNVRNYPFASGLASAQLATAGAGLGSLKPQPVPRTSNSKNARRARTLRRIMISGSTGDGATPFVWTEEMAKAFKRAALIRYNGWSHVNWMAIESPCVNKRITGFILRGKKPRPKRPPLCPFTKPAPPAGG